MSSKSTLAPWKRIDQKIVGDYRIFHLAKECYSRPPTTQRPERTHPFYIILSDDWVNVVPVTPSGRIILIRQFRAGSEEITIEVPGGMVEKQENSPANTAYRELEEETGFQAKTLHHLASIRPNPAILRNFCHIYLALDVQPTGTIQWDETEQIEVFEATWDEIDALILEGKINHSITLNALYFARIALKNLHREKFLSPSTSLD